MADLLEGIVGGLGGVIVGFVVGELAARRRLIESRQDKLAFETLSKRNDALLKLWSAAQRLKWSALAYDSARKRSIEFGTKEAFDEADAFRRVAREVELWFDGPTDRAVRNIERDVKDVTNLMIEAQRAVKSGGDVPADVARRLDGAATQIHVAVDDLRLVLRQAIGIHALEETADGKLYDPKFDASYLRRGPMEVLVGGEASRPNGHQPTARLRCTECSGLQFADPDSAVLHAIEAHNGEVKVLDVVEG